VRVCLGGRGRVTVAGVACFKPGHQSHFFYRLHVYRARKGEAKSFTWQDHRDFIVMTHLQRDGPVVWCWDNLNVHLADGLAELAVENNDWLEIFQLPSYAPDLNRQGGIWSLVKRGLANTAAANLDHLVRIMKRNLKRIQYRPHLIDGCLTGTRLVIPSQ
jgi:transposase